MTHPLIRTLCVLSLVVLQSRAASVTLNFAPTRSIAPRLTTSSASAEQTWSLTLGNPEALASLKTGDELQFSLADAAQSFVLVLTAGERAGSVRGWRAAIGGVECAAVYRGTNGWYIDINDIARGFVYQLRQVRGATWLATRVDVTQRQNECRGPRIRETASNPGLRLTTSSEGEVPAFVYLDILFAFDGNATRYVEDNRGQTLDAFAFSQLAKMNGVLANEKLDEKFLFRYAGTVSVTNTASNVEEGLNAAEKGTSGWEKIRAMRETYGADMVSLMIDTGTGTGWVGLGEGLTDVSQGSVIGFSEAAYHCVLVRAADWYDTELHEAGHNLGAGHSDKQDSGGAGPQSTSYSSGYYFTGKDDGVNYYTIMAYNYNEGAYYTQAPYFSSPDFSYKGTPVGTKDKNDNVRTIRQSTDYAWQWRQEKRSVFGPSAEWTAGDFKDGDAIDGFTLNLNGNSTDKDTGAIILDKGPIYITTPLNNYSEANGHEITVVVEIENVDTSKAATLVAFDIGGTDDYYANHAGLAFADKGSVSGIYKGVWPWTDWQDFTTYPSDKASHTFAFACSWMDSCDPGSGGYYGAMMALDGKVLGSCDQMEDSEKETVKRVAIGGRNGTTPQALAGAKITSVAIYTGALSPERLAKVTGDEEPQPEATKMMYFNRLAGDARVMGGTYGANIRVPTDGFRATYFQKRTSLDNGAAGPERGGNYSAIIRNGTDIVSHTVSGWFRVEKLPSMVGDDSATELYLARSYDGGHGGYKVAVDSTGAILVGKINNIGWNREDGSSVLKSTTAPITEGKWCHVGVAVTKSSSERKATVRVFVNGEEVEMSSGYIKTNLNGNSCSWFEIGADVYVAGIYVDSKALGEEATFERLATDRTYVVGPASIIYFARR